MQPSPFSLFFLPLILIFHFVGAYTEDARIDYFLLDCGSSENTTTAYSDGRTWRGDSAATSNFWSSNVRNGSFESRADRQGDSVEQVPYMTARIFKSQFTYSFPVSPGGGPKFLRLYFYPAVYSGIHDSRFFFTVTSGVHTLLKNFSASLTIAAMEPQVDTIVKEFCIHLWENQTSLNVTFFPTPSFYGFVNGIEVCSMPDNLYIRGESAPIPLVGTKSLFYIDKYTALETVYRLNVGGASFEERETGMFRKWQDDSNYIFSAASGVPWQGNDTSIRYTPATPPYTAPTAVYSSCRIMGPVDRINLNYNLTWIFPVDSGFSYLVRLHFCEIQDITRINERVFDIFLSNQTAQEKADVIAWSGGAGIPMYQDYVVSMIQDHDGIDQGGKQDLWLALHPNMASGSWFADAILNGLEIFKLNESYGSLAAPNPDPLPAVMVLQPQNNNSKGLLGRLSKFIIIGAAALLFAIFALSLVVYLFILRKRRRVWCWVSKQLMSLKHSSFSLPKEICRGFSLSELREATNDFDDVLIIGRGGFGDVYKGYIDGGDVIVAIKRLKSKSKQGAREFLTEIELLSQLRHQHLVSLIGYCECEEEGEKILVYDYMHHGTLRDHLYGSDHYDPLPWKRRLEICIGAARGLDYLHAGARHPIIHRDIKSTNILLDHKWVAKVADFGLSKMGPTHDPPVMTTMVKGTFGYMDPEYCKTMRLTEKSDVYSFGVVLMEVICGRAAVDRRLEYEQMSLANWARGCIEKGRVDEIIDPILSGQIADSSLEKFVETAYDCLLDQGIQRPTMGDVVARLEFALNLQDSVDSMEEALTLTLH